MRNFIDENAIISPMQHIFLFLNGRYTIAELKNRFSLFNFQYLCRKCKPISSSMQINSLLLYKFLKKTSFCSVHSILHSSLVGRTCSKLTNLITEIICSRKDLYKVMFYTRVKSPQWTHDQNGTCVRRSYDVMSV